MRIVGVFLTINFEMEMKIWMELFIGIKVQKKLRTRMVRPVS
jgi:hypothetical protein